MSITTKGQSTSGATILIVDDTPENLRLLSQILVQYGYKIRVANNGQHALESVRAAPPDLILLDIMMPGMDGYQVCVNLKQDDRAREIPVLFISALDATQDKIQAFAVGGVDYITKPFQAEEVQARVETHLSLRSLQKELQQYNEMLELRVRERTAELINLNIALERFLPREFLSLLNKESILNVHLGDQVQQELTILFADIRHFTSITEQMTPQDSFNFLNDYLSYISPVIRNSQGFIDKYIGDGLMALFPSAAHAVEAAIALQKAVERYNIFWQKTGHTSIAVVCALHTGSLMLGILGEAQRLQGTVISDAVNIAARLEQLTKLYGAQIIVSQQTLEGLPQNGLYQTRFLGKVFLKGKQQPLNVHEVLDGYPDDQRLLRLQSKEIFETGLEHFQANRFAESITVLQSVLQQNPLDQAAGYYLRRAEALVAQNVSTYWDEVDILPGVP